MKNAIVVGGGPYQYFITKYLKDHFKKVYIVNPVETPTTKLGDIIPFDINDIKNIIKMIKSTKIDLIISDQSDVAVIPVAELSRHFNLPHNPITSLNKFVNKLEMYEHAKDIGINVLDFYKVESLNDLKNIKYPFVLKPSDSTNSRGVYKINNKSEVEKFFFKSLEFSKSKVLIAQKYSDSKNQITVEGICTNGTHQTIISSKKQDYWNFCLTKGIKWPVNINEEIIEANDQFVNSTKIENCITHAEYILESDAFYLNEIAARGGGFGISSHIIPWVCEINLYDTLIFNKECIPKQTDKCAYLKFLDFSITNRQIEKLNNIRSIKMIENHSEQEYVKNIDNCRKSYIMLLCDNNKHLEKDLKKIEYVFNDNG